MAVLFQGEVNIMVNRHSCMGDGVSLTFPDCIIFSNTAGKYSLQNKPTGLIGTDYESIADAYLNWLVHTGQLKLEGDNYVPVE